MEGSQLSSELLDFDQVFDLLGRKQLLLLVQRSGQLADLRLELRTLVLKREFLAFRGSLLFLESGSLLQQSSDLRILLRAELVLEALP
eukprot:2104430-Amphidinium_carterae.1